MPRAERGDERDRGRDKATGERHRDAVTATIEATAAAASRPWARQSATADERGARGHRADEIAGAQQRRERIAMLGRVAEPRVPQRREWPPHASTIASDRREPAEDRQRDHPARAGDRRDAARRRRLTATSADVTRIEHAGEERRAGCGQRRCVRLPSRARARSTRTSRPHRRATARRCGAIASKSSTPSVAPPAAAIAPTSARSEERADRSGERRATRPTRDARAADRMRSPRTPRPRPRARASGITYQGRTARHPPDATSARRGGQISEVESCSATLPGRASPVRVDLLQPRRRIHVLQRSRELRRRTSRDDRDRAVARAQRGRRVLRARSSRGALEARGEDTVSAMLSAAGFLALAIAADHCSRSR